MIGTNLLPGHRAHARRLRRCIAIWIATLGTLTILVGGGSLGALATRAQPRAMPAGLTQRAETLEADLTRTRAQIDTFRHLRMARERADASLRWDALLDIIARASGKQIRLGSINLQPIPGATPSWSLALSGNADTKQSPADLAASLDATGLFQSVRHVLSPAPSPDSPIEFAIDCVIAPKAEPGDQP